MMAYTGGDGGGPFCRAFVNHSPGSFSTLILWAVDLHVDADSLKKGVPHLGHKRREVEKIPVSNSQDVMTSRNLRGLETSRENPKKVRKNYPSGSKTLQLVG